MTPALAPSDRYRTFAGACEAVVEHLSTRLGLDLLMVTRTEGDDWIILSRLDYGYGVEPGDVFPFRDTLCSRMLQGLGPRVAPLVELVPEYAAAPVATAFPIGTYFGLPLTRADGSLFGTLCGISPNAAPPALVDELPVLEVLSGLLSAVLERDLRLGVGRRAALHCRAREDGRGRLSAAEWRQALADESVECRELGTPALLVALRPEDSSRAGVAAAAAQVTEALGGSALVAEVDAGMLGVLLMGSLGHRPDDLGTALASQLASAGAPARVSSRLREQKEDLVAAWDAALSTLVTADPLAAPAR